MKMVVLFFLTGYTFTSTLPVDFKDYKLNEGDVLNIRSEINSSPESGPEYEFGEVTHYALKDFYGSIKISPGRSNYEDINFDYFKPIVASEDTFILTYLATILLELDPL